MLEEVNTLYKEIETTTDIDEKLRMMFDISTLLLNFDQKRALEVADEIKALSDELDNNIGRVYYHSTRGRVFFKKSLYPECEQEFKEALRVSLLTNSLLEQAMCHDSLGILNSYLNRYYEAIDACHQALNIYKQIDTKPSFRYQVVCNNNIGVAYRKLYIFDKAEEYLLAGLQLLEREEVGTLRFTLLNNLANVKYKYGNHKEGYELAKRALEGFVQQNHKSGEASTKVTIAYYYLSVGKYAIALTHFLGTLKLLKTINNIPTEIAVNRGMGEVYLKMEAFKEALEYLQKAMELALKTGDDQELCEVYLAQGKAFAIQQQPQKAKDVYSLGIVVCKKRNLVNMQSVFESQLASIDY